MNPHSAERKEAILRRMMPRENKAVSELAKENGISEQALYTVDIQLLSKHGLSLRQIAAEVGCAVNTVPRHLALETVPMNERKVKRQTKLEPFEEYLRTRHKAAHPDTIPATVVYREIVARDYQGGMSQLRAFMRTLRARVHGTAKEPPAEALKREAEHLQALPAPWRADIAAARPQAAASPPDARRPATVVSRIAQLSPLQHPLRVYDALLERVAEGVTA